MLYFRSSNLKSTQRRTDGDGPFRATFATALSIRLQSSRWQASTSTTYSKIQLAENDTFLPPSQIDEYRVDGILAALYVINLGIGPDPISPFVIYAACHNDAKCMDFDLSYLSALILDDELYEIVEIVYQFNTLEALNTSALHQNPLLKWAIHLLGIEVSKLY